jgi:hypothetical protein
VTLRSSAATRVPIRNPFDYVDSGKALKVFLKDFPSVSREQAIAALQARLRR